MKNSVQNADLRMKNSILPYAAAAVMLFGFVLLMHSNSAELDGPGSNIVHESETDWNPAPDFNLMETFQKDTFLDDTHEGINAMEELGDSEDDEDDTFHQVPMSPVVDNDDEEKELSHQDVLSMLHPMEAGKKKVRKIEHVGALPSNMGLLGVPVHVAKPKKSKAVHPAKKVKKAQKAKKHAVKKVKAPMKPPSGLDALVAARKKAHVKAGKFDTVEEAVAVLKKRMLKKVKAKKAKEDAILKQANKKVHQVQKWLDDDEAVVRGHVSLKAQQANEVAAQWLLKTKDAKGKAVDLRRLHELIHWHRVAASGGLSPKEVRLMVDRANKKHLPASTVVSQVTSANAKAAAFKAIQKTTPKNSLFNRIKVADKAIADVSEVAHMLDEKHRKKVAQVARHKVHTLLDLQLALEGRVADSVGLAEVSAGDFCETEWYRTVLLGKGCAEGN